MFRAYRVFAMLVICAALAPPAAAINWATLLREAGESGGKAATHGLDHLGPAARAVVHLRDLKNAPKGAVAAHAMPDGSWQLINRDGLSVTVPKGSDFTTALKSVGAGGVSSGDSRVALYLSEESVFANRGALSSLPNHADLYVVTHDGAFALTRTATANGVSVKAILKPNVIVEVVSREMFDETVFFLNRPLKAALVRRIAFDGSANKPLRSVPAIDPQTKLALTDAVNPDAVADSLAALKGQTTIVTGRIENGKLVVNAGSKGDVVLDIDALRRAARDADTNLIILGSDTSKQAIGRNWLWQDIKVDGVDDAAAQATLGDFLSSLGEKRGTFSLTTEADDFGRVRITGVSDPARPAEGGNVLADIAQKVVETAVTSSIDVDARNSKTQKEFDGRLIPGVPTAVQVPYLVGLVLGLISFQVTGSWWKRIWPAAADSGSATRWVRRLIYVLVFMPLTGSIAFIWMVLQQMWMTVTSPFRWVWRRLARRTV